MAPTRLSPAAVKRRYIEIIGGELKKLSKKNDVRSEGATDTLNAVLISIKKVNPDQHPYGRDVAYVIQGILQRQFEFASRMHEEYSKPVKDKRKYKDYVDYVNRTAARAKGGMEALGRIINKGPRPG